MKSFKTSNLKAGVMIAVLLPGVFIFDKAGDSLLNKISLFLTFFLLILLLWTFNGAFINFTGLLRRGRYQKFHPTYLFIILSLVISVPLYFILGLLFQQEQLLFGALRSANYSFKSWFYIILRIMMFDAGLLILKLLIDNNKEKQLIKLENEKLKTEQLKAVHETFKQQVDPHFLFNALNTLQSLVKQRDTDNTLLFIQELSHVYRYMLTRRIKDFVTVADEIEFLQSYLYLLRIRFGQAFNTVITVSEEHMQSRMPVHTLQLLAENAVKHNIINRQQPLTLEITSENGHLSVKNNLSPKPQEVAGSGIGLTNINNRYSLLFGRQLTISSGDGYFKVMLPIVRAGAGNLITNYEDIDC